MADGIVVIGATGTTGSLVLAALAAAATGRETRAAGRNGPTRFDWDDAATHAAALDGVSAAYLVPPPGSIDPAAVMVPFLQRSGLSRVVLLSAQAIETGGPGVGQVAAALPGLVPEAVVLRPSWFMQNTVGDHQIARGIRRDGLIRTATGSGRLPFIDAADIAAVASTLLLQREPPTGRDHVLTGPAAMSYDQVAATISEVSGRIVRHEQVSATIVRDEVYAELGAGYAGVMAGLDEQIARGAWSATTDEVEKLTGRPAGSFQSFARSQVKAWG